MSKNEEQEKFLNEINELLNQIKNEQTNIAENINKYHKINMKNFAKLKEFNQILDMTNQIFEKRISNIEQILIEKLKKQ